MHPDMIPKQTFINTMINWNPFDKLVIQKRVFKKENGEKWRKLNKKNVYRNQWKLIWSLKFKKVLRHLILMMFNLEWRFLLFVNVWINFVKHYHYNVKRKIGNLLLAQMVKCSNIIMSICKIAIILLMLAKSKLEMWQIVIASLNPY